MTDIATTTNLPAVQNQAPSAGGLLANPERFEFGWRAAKLFASSQLVPQHLRDKPQDCFIAIHMAERLGEDPLITMQNIYIVSGRAGWSAQYMIGRANRAGVFKGRINWRIEGKGDGLAVTAFAKLADTEELVEATASMAMAVAEGWTKNPKYKSMPELMLRYRSATMLVRLYAPDVMLGIPTSEELQDMRYAGTLRPAADGGYEVTEGDETVTAEADPFEQAAAGAAPKEEPQAEATKKTEQPKASPQEPPADDDDEWAQVDPGDWPEIVARLIDMIDACRSRQEIDVLLAAPKFAAYHAAQKHAPKARGVLDEEIARKRKEMGA